MSDNHIINPATWLNGTVVSPSWLQQVQDNINGIFNGNRSVKSVFIDGTGGGFDGYTPTAGAMLQVNGDGYFTGKSTFIGNVKSGGNGSFDGYMVAGGACSASGAVFDGLGGTVGTYISGAVTVSSTAATGTSAPTPTFHRGTLYRDTVPLAWGFVSSGALVCGVNVAGVAHTASTGVYNITLNVGAGSTNSLCPVASAVGENITCAVQPTAANAFTVITTKGQIAPSGGRQDMDFYFIVFGG